MRVSPDGLRFAYVNRSAGVPLITVITPGSDTERGFGPGQDPRWRGPDKLWWRPQDDGPLCFCDINAATGPVERSRLASGNSLAVAGIHTAVHRTDPVRLIEDGFDLAQGFAWPVYSDDASLLAALHPDAPHPGMQSIELFGPGSGRRLLYQGSVVDGTQGSDFRMSGTTLCFREASGHVFGLVDAGNAALSPDLLARPEEGVSHACPLFVPGRGLYVLHVRASGGATGRVCLASWTSMMAGTPRGWVLDESGGGGYEHDLRLQADTTATALVAWTTPNGGARWAHVDVSQGATLITPTPFGVRVTVPKALGYFYERGRPGTFHPQRNCTATGVHLWDGDFDGDGRQERPADIEQQIASAIDDAGLAFVSARPEDFASPAVRARWSKVLGVWTHEPDDAGMARAWVDDARAAMTAAGLPQRPVITILVEEQAANPAFAGIGDAIAPEIYFERPEPTYEQQLAVARARIEEVCRALAPSPLYLCIQAFDRIAGGTQWQQAPWALEALQQAGNEALARAQVKGLWWFAYGRQGGVKDYPQLERWHVAQLAVTPSPSPIVDPPKPTKPPQEKPVSDITQVPKPGQAEYEDLMVFLHEVCYQGELKRAGGLFESPSPQTDRIFDARKPRGEVVMDQAAFRWVGEYTQAWFANLATPGGPHEAAKAHIRRIIHDSDEARQKRGETSTNPQ